METGRLGDQARWSVSLFRGIRRPQIRPTMAEANGGRPRLVGRAVPVPFASDPLVPVGTGGRPLPQRAHTLEPLDDQQDRRRLPLSCGASSRVLPAPLRTRTWELPRGRGHLGPDTEPSAERVLRTVIKTTSSQPWLRGLRCARERAEAACSAHGSLDRRSLDVGAARIHDRCCRRCGPNAARASVARVPAQWGRSRSAPGARLRSHRPPHGHRTSRRASPCAFVRRLSTARRRSTRRALALRPSRAKGPGVGMPARQHEAGSSRRAWPESRVVER